MDPVASCVHEGTPCRTRYVSVLYQPGGSAQVNIERTHHGKRIAPSSPANSCLKQSNGERATPKIAGHDAGMGNPIHRAVVQTQKGCQFHIDPSFNVTKVQTYCPGMFTVVCERFGADILVVCDESVSSLPSKQPLC